MLVRMSFVASYCFPAENCWKYEESPSRRLIALARYPASLLSGADLRPTSIESMSRLLSG